MSNEQPGPLIGRGRAADVFDLGGGLVLRRNRDGSPTDREAAAMRHLHEHGYPVPTVHESSGADLVMERLVGATMLDAFGRRPWHLRSWARLLATLHEQLARVPVPGFELPTRFGRPQTLVHADLHPDNVVLTDRGPVVIDWTNVSVGPRGADVANTWLIVAASELDSTGPRRAVQSAARSFFLRTFLDHADRELARSMLREAAEHRLTDRNVRPGEAVRIREIVRDEVGGDDGG